LEPRSALIIGAGIAGITSAVELARNGISVHLVDKQATMGGQVARFGCKATESCSKCSACVLTEKIAELRDAPSVRFHPCSRIKQIRRDGGDFRVGILQGLSPLRWTDALRADCVPRYVRSSASPPLCSGHFLTAT